MTDTPAIETRGLTRRFGRLTAVDELDLSVPAGSVFGFLGRNGAGKTVTIRMLTGLSRITSGQARVAGIPVTLHSAAVRSVAGYLPDHPRTYEWMTGRENLLYAAKMFGLSGGEAGERVSRLLETVGIAHAADRRTGGYSAGMHQRLGIAQALIGNPKILVMDEPTASLDPVGRAEVLELISSLRGRDTTIFMSTHLLMDVERVCDTVAIIDRGRLVVQSSVAELRRKYAVPAVEIELESPDPALRQALAGLRCVERVEDAPGTPGLRYLVHLTEWSGESREAVFRQVGERAAAVRSYSVVQPDLEKVFMSLVGREGQGS